jgi:hypothetical protein
MTNLDDERLLRSYLLGELRDPDQERIEARMFADDGYFGRLLTAEEELIRDYVRRRLPGSVRRRFERRLAASPDWPIRVAEARALNEVLGDQSRGEDPKARGWMPSASAFRPGAVLPGLAVAAAIVAVLAGGTWLVADRRALTMQLERAEAERAELQRRTDDMTRRLTVQESTVSRLSRALAPKPAGEPAQGREPIAFLLFPGAARSDEDETATLRVPADVDLRLLLVLGQRRGHAAHRVILRTMEGVQVWGEEALASPGATERDIVEVRLPAIVLEASEYVLRLQGITESAIEDVDAYLFRVLR